MAFPWTRARPCRASAQHLEGPGGAGWLPEPDDLNRLRDNEVAKLPGIGATGTLLVMAPRFDRR